ncbi:MAG: nickel-dependent hydrogenase large subunit [Pirellulales bacterium]|nr:nickel-dependent hydrogenase large subunit [Pirellulales bacterium]
MNAAKKKNDDVRTIQVKALARVEGEGALNLTMRGGKVENVEFKIYEPPRFYEAFLRGRGYEEVPDITARICGICPVAYQMSSCHALEKAMGVFEQVDPAIRSLRNLLYCGEWIESHVLHMFMLHLPDFLGYESAISMAQDHGAIVKRSLRIKKSGNDLVELLGGRAVHPVGVCVGGFYRAPRPSEAAALLPEIQSCRDDLCDLMLELAGIVQFPKLERDYEFVALCPDDEYPMNLGRIKSNKGLNVAQEEFGTVTQEQQVEHSTALHAVLKARGAYAVGPLARLNLNAEKLHPRSAEVLQAVAKAIKQPLPWRNSYLAFLARGIESVHALALAADLLGNYTPPVRSRIPITPRSGIGGHGTEAPRGICWHEYRTETDGTIASARIMAPTSQNQKTIEEDLCQLAEQVAALSDEETAMRCEHLIRNYDPCISCSTHFLKLTRTNV